MKSGITLRKGSWDSAEDALLRRCIQKYGEGKWHLVPQRAGLNRCRKSCRLRWLNYLRPAIKRGNFGADELDLIVRLHNLLGNRWSLIAGRLPGRTANDIKNYWSTSAHKKLIITSTTTASFHKGVVKKENPTGTKQDGKIATNASGTHLVIKPIPRALSKGKTYNLNPINHISSHSADRINNNNNNNEKVTIKPSSPAKFPSDEDGMEWSENLFSEIEMHGQEETSSDGTLMAPWTGLEDMDIAARGRHIWMVDESTDPATEDNDWSDIWDFLNHDNN